MRGHVRKYKDRWAGIIYLGKDEFGKEKRKWIYHNDKKQCEKLVNEYIYKYENGLILENDKSMTFEKWFEMYKEIHSNLKQLSFGTLRDYDTIYKNYLHILKDKKLKDIKISDIQILYNNILKNNKTTKQVKKVHSVLSVFIRGAYKQQYIERNIMDFIEVPTIEKYKPKIIDIDTFLKVYDLSKGTYIEAIIVLGAGLGLRLGEMLGLQISNIDFNENVIHIKKQLKRNKGGTILSEKLKTDSSNRVISMPPDVIKFLEKYIDKINKNIVMYEKYTQNKYINNDLLICKDDGTFKPHTTVERNWKELLIKNNIEHFRIHDLRHYNATLMLKLGIPDKVARDRLGHTTLDMTDRYQHVTKDIDKTNAEKIKIF